MYHFIISIVKSFIRLTGCILCIIISLYNIMASIVILCSGLILAEILGIMEELRNGK